jgi:hypothetical protein
VERDELKLDCRFGRNGEMHKSLQCAIALVGIGIIAGSIAALGARTPTPVEIRPVWKEFKWPFALDQWGIGRAFVCKPAACGDEVSIYLRPKIGFCKCATGVSDDEELDRVSDHMLINLKMVARGRGRPIDVAWMHGRSRAYTQPGTIKDWVLSIAFNDRCDVIVAVATLGRGNRQALEPAVIAFLNTDPVIRWVKWLIT